MKLAFSGVSEFVELGAGYTFYTSGHPEGQPRQHGVGFAVRNSLVSQLADQPRCINPRLMTLKLKLCNGRLADFISAYAPTMAASDEEKESFYSELSSAISSVPYRDRLFILGDFNARVELDHTTWTGVLGPHSVGNENSNGTLLLLTCSQHELAITNTLFQQANKYKTTWMHPRSKHWHMLDYIITRQRDVSDVHRTRVARGTDCWSDHRLVRSTVALNLNPPKRRHARARRKKLDVSKLQSTEVRTQLQCRLNEALASGDVSARQPVSIEEDWASIRDTTYRAAEEVLGFRNRQAASGLGSTRMMLSLANFWTQCIQHTLRGSTTRAAQLEN